MVNLEEATIKAIASPELFEKYVSFTQNQKVNMDPKLFWCPRPGCNTHIDSRLFKKRKGVCSTCNSTVCLKCGARFHRKKNCALMIDNEFGRWAARSDVNPCPKCRIPVEKDEGCQHMTCSVCRYQWCWVCGGKYTNNHYKPFNLWGCVGMQFSTNKLGWLFLRLLVTLIFLPLLIIGFFTICGNSDTNCYSSRTHCWRSSAADPLSDISF